MLRRHDVIIRALSYHRTPLDPQATVTTQSSAATIVRVDSHRCLQLPLQLMVSRQIFNTLAPIVVGLEGTVDDRCLRLCTTADTFRFATSLVFDFDTPITHFSVSQRYITHLIHKPDVVLHVTLCSSTRFIMLEEFLPQLMKLPHLESFTSVGFAYSSEQLELLLRHPNESIRTKSVRHIVESHTPTFSSSLIENTLIPLVEGASSNGALSDYLYITLNILSRTSYQYSCPTAVRARLFDLALGFCQSSTDTQVRDLSAWLLRASVAVTVRMGDQTSFWPLTEHGSLIAAARVIMKLLTSAAQPPSRNSFGFSYICSPLDCDAEFSTEISLTLHECTKLLSSDPQEAAVSQSPPANTAWINELFEVCLRNAERRHFMWNQNTGHTVVCSLESSLWILASQRPKVAKKCGLLHRAGEVLRDWHRGFLAHKLRLRRLLGNADEQQLHNAAFAQHPPADSVFVAVRVLAAALKGFDQPSQFAFDTFGSGQDLDVADWLLFTDELREGALDLAPALRDFMIGGNNLDCVWDIAARIESFFLWAGNVPYQRPRWDYSEAKQKQRIAVYLDLFKDVVEGALFKANDL